MHRQLASVAWFESAVSQVQPGLEHKWSKLLRGSSESDTSSPSIKGGGTGVDRLNLSTITEPLSPLVLAHCVKGNKRTRRQHQNLLTIISVRNSIWWKAKLLI